MNRMTYSLVGYDRLSERVVEEVDVPDTILPRAKELARVPADDPDAVMCYPLDAARARDLANLLGATIDTEGRDYFLEGFAYEFADDAEFRVDDPPGWSAWIHNDATRDHIKVLVARTTLDEYARDHGLKDHRAVVDLLNASLKDQVREIVSRAIDGGRATAGRLELTGDDLAPCSMDRSVAQPMENRSPEDKVLPDWQGAWR